LLFARAKAQGDWSDLNRAAPYELVEKAVVEDGNAASTLFRFLATRRMSDPLRLATFALDTDGKSKYDPRFQKLAASEVPKQYVEGCQFENRERVMEAIHDLATRLQFELKKRPAPDQQAVNNLSKRPISEPFASLLPSGGADYGNRVTVVTQAKSDTQMNRSETD
jgi:hypothetical protein